MATASAVRRVVRQKAKGPIDPSVGEKVRALRVQRGITQRALAEPEFTKGFISHVETGRTRISLRAAGILATRLGVKVTDLLATPAGGREARVELRLLESERAIAEGQPRAALDLLENLGAPAQGQGRARARRLIGRALVELGRSADAVKPLAEALALATRDGADELRTRVLYDLADAHAQLDAPGEALTYLLEAQRALEARTLVDRTLELRVAALLAATYARLGDLAGAGRHADRANAIARDVVDARALASTYASLLAVREQQGDLEGALLYARKGLDLQEARGRELAAAHAWNNIAWVQLQRGQLSEANAAIVRAVTVLGDRVPRQRAHFLLTRAEIALAQGDVAAAERFAREALAVEGGRDAVHAGALLLLAQAAAQKRKPITFVRASFERALRAHGKEPPKLRAKAHEVYAEYLAARGLATDAYTHAQRALQLQRPALS